MHGGFDLFQSSSAWSRITDNKMITVVFITALIPQQIMSVTKEVAKHIMCNTGTSSVL